MPYNFALTGASGYVAPRHLKAIKETGNRLIAAVDPHDSVGILDGYFDRVAFFTEFERFDRHIEKLRRLGSEKAVHYVSICSPNYLHDAHCRFALRVGANAICEKPLVLNPWNIDALKELEEESDRRIYTILQLRVHPALIALRARLQAQPANAKNDVRLTYITSRGPWYLVSWKGQIERSGGLATNIGIHFFDMLMWFFGGVRRSAVHLANPLQTAGFLELDRARVQWFLSINQDDLPDSAKAKGQRTYRSITIDGEEIEFSEGFTDLHTLVYRETLAGRGFGLEDARPSIELVHDLRAAVPVGLNDDAHPCARRCAP
ncbi:MAG TPA: Gfo/Idh/MocA family oxidoreductase [candidate division Zixibacteria bacterium]|nr:Gfo/Idh/MocA family oxidoreductase [candidate division Zixibacteria bacterium]MDD4918637.1 Gfo/Idh/MocA family oxidoreductase [candidate division Zixibacteria bacterium]MDM7971749.1 Gfo/Idh/MocA family oxidoreductase [candidate division Zixibacteria bacterium]HOD67257.1 Gfo/Idh/MocA family oxidoreductase [candidate division Zixibacteria bacterium]HOZ08295.1 Gfo/Idh/MocA family oxidoreductase [candidate division Zixibacteria bacterium]